MSNWSGSKKKWPRTVNEARRWIDFDNPDLSIRQQCRLLGLHRSNVYYDPAPESAENLYLMRLMDEEHLRRPNRGSRQMVDFLSDEGYRVNRKRIQRLMRKMGIEGVAPKGRAIDNVMIERLWRTVKYEEVYLKEYRSGSDCYQGLDSYLDYYDHQRRHQSLARKTPWEAYRPNRANRFQLSI